MNPARAKYFIAAVSSTVIWGFFSIPLRNIRVYPSDQILHYRILTSLLIVWAVIILFRRDHLMKDLRYLRNQSGRERKKLIFLTLLSGVLLTGNWFSFIYAVNHINLRSAAFAYMVCPLITAIGGFLILKEKLSALKFSALGLAGISILILATGSYTDVSWSVFIAALYGCYLIIQRVLNKVDKFNMLGVQLLITTLLISPVLSYRFEGFPDNLYFWANIVVIAIFFTIIPLFLSIYALIGLPSSTLGIIIYINPIVAFAVAFFYFHEQIDEHQFWAYSLLLAAVVLFNWNLIAGLTGKLKKSEIAVSESD